MKRSFSEVEETDGVQLNELTPTGMEKEEFDFSHIHNFISTARVSPTKRADQFWQLENAIQQGDIDLAIKLIKQTNSYLERRNDQGETPLLMAAKFNQNKLIVAILKKQPEFARQVDKQGNNLLHLLANISENKARTSIDNVFMLLNDQLKVQLMLERNQFEQTPDQIARNQRNMEYVDLFNHQVNFLDSS
jgi:ankyrin repeat protein